MDLRVIRYSGSTSLVASLRRGTCFSEQSLIVILSHFQMWPVFLTLITREPLLVTADIPTYSLSLQGEKELSWRHK